MGPALIPCLSIEVSFGKGLFLVYVSGVWSAYHVTGLGGGAGKDEDDLGAGGAATGLELVAGRSRLADLEVSDAGVDDFDWGRGGEGNSEGEDAEELHFECGFLRNEFWSPEMGAGWLGFERRRGGFRF